MRITLKQIEAVIEWLNKELKRPLKPYENIDGKLTAQIGNFHLYQAYGAYGLLYQAYGAYGLHEMNNEHGGIKTIVHSTTKTKTKKPMNKDNTYNGWTNYETWRVNLELFNGDDEAWGNSSSDGMREFAEQLIEESTDEGIGRDYAMAFLDNVNWQEIAEHYEQEEEVA